jgi:hypothetical protein
MIRRGIGGEDPRGADDLEGLAGRFKGRIRCFGGGSDVFYRGWYRYNELVHCDLESPKQESY